MSTGYGQEGIRQVCVTLLVARHVPERLCSVSALLEALYQVFNLYLYLLLSLASGNPDLGRRKCLSYWPSLFWMYHVCRWHYYPTTVPYWIPTNACTAYERITILLLTAKSPDVLLLGNCIIENCHCICVTRVCTGSRVVNTWVLFLPACHTCALFENG